jgi:hypothetical protein
MDPDFGRDNPETVLSIVDFPAPFPPSRETISPEETERETSRRARTSP